MESVFHAQEPVFHVLEHWFHAVEQHFPLIATTFFHRPYHIFFMGRKKKIGHSRVRFSEKYVIFAEKY